MSLSRETMPLIRPHVFIASCFYKWGLPLFLVNLPSLCLYCLHSCQLVQYNRNRKILKQRMFLDLSCIKIVLFVLIGQNLCKRYIVILILAPTENAPKKTSFLRNYDWLNPNFIWIIIWWSFLIVFLCWSEIKYCCHCGTL